MKAYTFNDVDRMKELSDDLKAHSKTMHPDVLFDSLEELLELVEIHPRSSLNLCLCGGMQTLIEIMFDHPNAQARKKACSIFSFAV